MDGVDSIFSGLNILIVVYFSLLKLRLVAAFEEFLKNVAKKWQKSGHLFLDRFIIISFRSQEGK